MKLITKKTLIPAFVFLFSLILFGFLSGFTIPYQDPTQEMVENYQLILSLVNPMLFVLGLTCVTSLFILLINIYKLTRNKG